MLYFALKHTLDTFSSWILVLLNITYCYYYQY
jgi:hypothetical protein